MAHLDLRLPAVRTDGPLVAIRRLALKARLLFARWRLDTELAAGVDPNATARLRLRATEITTPRYRRRLARSLLRLSNEGLTEARPRLSAALPVRRDELAEARETLDFLAQVLLFAEGVDARGVAMIRQLLADGGSPLYCPAERGALDARLRTALRFLLGQSARASGRRTLWAANGGSVGGR